MTAELRDWLAELAESQPTTAAEVGAALVAVLGSADLSGLAMVGEAGRQAGSVADDPRAQADYGYKRRLEQLQLLRRRVADAATQRHRAELRLSELQAAGADKAVLDSLAEQLAAAQQREAAIARASQHSQAEVDAFRVARDTAKARYTAAEASLRVAEAIAAIGGEPDPDLAQRREDLRAAEERLRALDRRTQPEAVTRRQPDQAAAEHPPAADRPIPPPEPRRGAEPVPGLLELRADPLGSDIRILFAAEPPDTVTLLAVLEGPDAVREHGAQAITLAGDLLTEIRGDGWPTDIDEVEVADQDEFLARFFPADDGRVASRAAVLAATTSLGALRADLHLTIEEVAARSGVPRHRIEAIERDGLRTAHVHEAVALARVLGARLELPAGSGPVAG
jgi:DNA-binding XRE family transcriptional regulator